MRAVEIKKPPDPEVPLLPDSAGMKDLDLHPRENIRNPVAWNKYGLRRVFLHLRDGRENLLPGSEGRGIDALQEPAGLISAGANRLLERSQDRDRIGLRNVKKESSQVCLLPLKRAGLAGGPMKERSDLVHQLFWRDPLVLDLVDLLG